MNCAVLENRPLAGGFFYLSLKPDQPFGAITPGQFVMIRCGDGLDPLLRRPMSVADFAPDGSRLGLLIQQKGKGTELLAELQAGAHVDVIGLFGNGFDPPRGRVWMVAGGTGIAPFMGYVQTHRAQAGSLTVFLGARSAESLLMRDVFERAHVALRIATDDGSAGHHGLVTALLEKALANETPPEMILACGPEPMMTAVAALAARRGVPCGVSLEARMACGFGACLGCVTKVKGPELYVTVCQKGPVFDAAQIEFGL
ncbi:MAG: dihydroorotate dehydrogenase electron transfer subunit [Nitrospinae bacterium]|nr:dihydroorotate dehydrogenase electron transfer subunit [Nitrospinota bacterium]